MELLRTSRTLLRRWREDDLHAYFEIYSRWEVMRWLGAQPRRVVADLDEARERLARRREREAGLPSPYGLWALLVTDPAGHWGADPVGTVLLLPLQDASGMTTEVEIGWNLHPDHQGRGLVTEAARALLGAAEQAGLTRVLALTDPDNTASQAVAGRLGMLDEGLTDRWFATTTRQFRWSAARP
ncbi:GNAT family N-acetyltransferase [Actinoplanes sp. NPDC051346]|uniref:GNAT family N-acetyltransferase n=1 Tax=Actinoplanes sp. NPDC051346 TaxID=3155048 RepID=UPI0034336602